jgi:uncharacterized protein YjbI with pentapeptide repeats
MATGHKNGRSYLLPVWAVNPVGTGSAAKAHATPTTARNCTNIGPHANLQNWPLDFHNFTGVDLTGANLSGAHLGYTTFTNVDLTGASLSGATLAATTWSNTTCPDGSNSDTNLGSTCMGFGI